jgi:hypothetical protein
MSYSILRISLKTPAFVLTVQWVANPLCAYTLYCVPYSVVSLRTKDLGMISSVHSCVMYISFRRIALDLFQIFIIIIRPYILIKYTVYCIHFPNGQRLQNKETIS